MDNQNNNLANNQPGSVPAASEGQSATPTPPAAQSATTVSSPSPAQPPAQPPPAENEADKVNVIMPEKSNTVPKWFYLFFILVILIFLTVTGLLISAIIKKNRSDKILPEAQISPKVTLNQSQTASVTPIPTKADFGALFYEKQSDSDEPAQIEADLNQTDTVYVEEAIGELDTEVNTP